MDGEAVTIVEDADGAAITLAASGIGAVTSFAGSMYTEFTSDFASALAEATSTSTSYGPGTSGSAGGQNNNAARGAFVIGRSIGLGGPLMGGMAMVFASVLTGALTVL